MLRDKLRKGKLYRYTGTLDEYAQETDEKQYVDDIEFTLLEYQRQVNHTSPIYDEVTHMIVTDFDGITDDCVIVVSDEESFNVLYAPDSIRRNVCYVRRVYRRS